MAFLETPRFPDEIAFWAVGGRAFQTTVVETYGGEEYRNSAWQIARGEWDFSEGLRTADANASAAFAPLAQKLLRNFFLVNYGQFGAFRFKNFADYTDEGQGYFVAIDATHFQMFKHYVSGALTYDQPIYKPSSVSVTGGTGATVDLTTGIVTVSGGTPTAWQGTFDIPVRFGDDMPKMGPDPSGALYNWQGIKLIEVRNP